MSEDKRPRLDDILGGSGDDFNSLWDATAAAGDFEPLPPGRYSCLVVDGKRAESKAKATPSYKVTFEVIEPAEFAGRKLWHDLWLTAKALPTSKRDLAKLRIIRPDQMRQAPPTGLIAEVKVALRTGDDGESFNRVSGFEVTGEAPPTDALEPDGEELSDDEVAAPPPAPPPPASAPHPERDDEGNTRTTAGSNGTDHRASGKPDLQRATGDAYPASPTSDDDGFNWRLGEHNR